MIESFRNLNIIPLTRFSSYWSTSTHSASGPLLTCVLVVTVEVMELPPATVEAVVGVGAGVVSAPGTKPGFRSGPPAGFCIVGAGVVVGTGKGGNVVVCTGGGSGGVVVVGVVVVSGVVVVVVGVVVVVVSGVVVVVRGVVMVVSGLVVVVGGVVVVVVVGVVVVVSGVEVVVMMGGKVNVLLVVGGTGFAVGTPPDSIPGPEGPGGFSLPPGSSA